MDKMTEMDILRSIRLALSEHGYCVFRINSGKVKMADGRWFETGVPRGFSDLFAVKDGKAYFIECKNDTGKPTAEQLNFIKQMQTRYGCRAGIARSVEDALKIVKGENDG
jgi:Holliday junction resolvase